MPAAAVVFAVGDRVQAEVFLQSDHLADGGVLDGLQFGVRDLARLAFGPGVHQRLGADQTADMVGAERGLGALGHQGSL